MPPQIRDIWVAENLAGNQSPHHYNGGWREGPLAVRGATKPRWWPRCFRPSAKTAACSSQRFARAIRFAAAAKTVSRENQIDRLAGLAVAKQRVVDQHSATS
jgi:hypothetical protein